MPMIYVFTTFLAIMGPHTPTPTSLIYFFSLFSIMSTHWTRSWLIPAVYVITVALGTLTEWIGAIPNSSYFSSKHNLLNVWFVKMGWFWTTGLFLVWAWIVLLKRRPRSDEIVLQLVNEEDIKNEENKSNQLRKAYQEEAKRNRKRFKLALLRWLMATLYWLLINQWMFGPSLTDRVYLWSGGGCYPKHPNGQPFTEQWIHTNMEEDPLHPELGINWSIYTRIRSYLTSTDCRRAGGHWYGGHDISGHIMLLVHASLFLHLELSGIRQAAKYSTAIYPKLARYATTGIRFLITLWWWMLLMSSTYPFHPFFEKVTGLLIAILYWIVIYGWFLPKYKPNWMPGFI
jgi:hypothetical protein